RADFRMHFLYERETRNALPWLPLIDGIRGMFRSGCEMPARHHHSVAMPGEEDGTLLLMPAWTPGKHIGVKMVTVVPGNSARALPAISGAYLLSCGKTGQLQSVMDGAELTARRTAAASALAASYLARKDAEKLLIVGAGRLSLNLIEAHSAVRPIASVAIWARRPEQASDVVVAAQKRGIKAEAVTDLESAVKSADIVSCCTLSREPLVLGQWLTPGTHVDLVGAFKSDMRESDNAAIKMATVFADTRDGVLKEGGDILQPLNSGVIDAAHIAADLYDLCQLKHPGRTSEDEITLFKSVGAALEDLAAAEIVYANSNRII
ncbi:MAG: ornithine cyclodeaminase family protein, partial [Sneathiella sp.]|nr:ornithine cyclodeaminase family protein [Sneathiella sp.]